MKKNSKLDRMNELEAIVLETLSFYHPMNCAQIIMQLDDKKIGHIPYTLEDLKKLLKRLTKQGRLKCCKAEVGPAWQRILKRKSWWRRIFF